MTKKEKETVKVIDEVEKEKPRKNMVYINISERQIIQKFPSKNKKDKNGNPFELAKVLLPSEEYSSNFLGKNATIVLPAFLISDGKFAKEGRKVISLAADREIEVHLQGKKVKEASEGKDAIYENKSIKVNAHDLKKSFTAPEKKKEKELESKK